MHIARSDITRVGSYFEQGKEASINRGSLAGMKNTNFDRGQSA